MHIFFLLRFFYLILKVSTGRKNLIRWGVFAIFAIALAQAMLGVIKLSPFAHIIAEKNSIFVVGYFELFKNPFEFFQGNMKGLTTWLVTYFSTLLILVIVAFINFRKYPRGKAAYVFIFHTSVYSFGVLRKSYFS